MSPVDGTQIAIIYTDANLPVADSLNQTRWLSLFFIYSQIPEYDIP